MLAVNVAMYFIDLRAAVLLTGFTVIYLGIILFLYFYNKPGIMNELISFAAEYGQIQKRLLRELDLPYALLDSSGKVLWTNEAFEKVTHLPKGYRKSITALFPAITRDRLPDESEVEETEYELVYEGN